MRRSGERPDCTLYATRPPSVAFDRAVHCEEGFPREAEDYVARIIRRCDAIATAPYQGESLERLRPGMRRTGMEGRVSIVFTVELEKVTILAIAYGGRQFETALRS
jgi:toxin ParE1/3/4